MAYLAVGEWQACEVQGGGGGGGFLPQVSPMGRLGPAWEAGGGNLFQINRSGQQSHRSNYLPRLFVLYGPRPPRVDAPGRPPGWQLPQTDLFTELIYGWVIIGFAVALHIVTFPSSDQSH